MMALVTMPMHSSNDPNETMDSDGDTVGDNADAFSYDASETMDSDDDGVGDNADAFPTIRRNNGFRWR